MQRRANVSVTPALQQRVEEEGHPGTHHRLMRASRAVGDRHHVLNKGEICFSGSAAELENNEFVLRNYLSV